MIDWTMDTDGPVGRLTLRSSDSENRLGPDDIRALEALAAALVEDDAIRVLVITGSEGRFSEGWSPAAAVPGAFEQAGAPWLDPFGFLAELPLPVICGIDGDAFSAGLELALACDIRVASTRARFALPETEHGLIPLAGATQRLPRLIGRGWATEMVLLGTMVSAEQALGWGLVNSVVEPAALDQALAKTAGVIARRGPIAERFAKEAIRQGAELPLARALRYELDLTVLLQTTEDRAEGVRAFAEKRPPKFTGR